VDALKKFANKTRWMEKNGYILNGRGRPLHRIVCAKAWGRFPQDWIVHHIDFDKKNNHPDNLVAMPRKLHDRIHTVMTQERTKFDRKTIEGYLRPYKNPYKVPKNTY
jgi:hypothetical protein